MKRVFVTAIVILFAATAFAASTKDTLKRIGENAQVSNGSYRVLSYEADRFNTGAIINQMKREFTERFPDCGEPLVVVGREKNIDTIAGNDPINSIEDPDTADSLQKLHKKGLLKSIISVRWDESTGESEYCSAYQFEIYTEDGYVLDLGYNFTD